MACTRNRSSAIRSAATDSRHHSTQRVLQGGLGAAAIALSQACAGPSRAPIAVSAADSIVLERSMCYGTCPAYRLSVTADGRVSFLSLNPADSGRAAADTISREKFASLVSQAESLGFFTLPDTIANDLTLCPLRATDHPSATLTLFRTAGNKHVVDYHGCVAQSDRSAKPIITQLRSFEAEVDSTARSDRWVKPAKRAP